MIKILKYGEVANQDIFARTEPTVNVEATVQEIIRAVREKGDAALYEFCEKFDHAKLNSLAVTPVFGNPRTGGKEHPRLPRKAGT